MAYWDKIGSENEFQNASRDTGPPSPLVSSDPSPPTTPQSKIPTKRRWKAAILSGVSLAFWMALQHACQQEQQRTERERRQTERERQQTESANVAAATFWLEPHTLWGEIKYAVSAKTSAGSVDLKPGDFVWVTARSSTFARISTTNGTEAVIPLSAIEFGAVTK
jgi:hypothetical protein